MATNNPLLYRFIILLTMLIGRGICIAQQYATPYEKSRGHIVTASVKQQSNDRRVLEGNPNGDTTIANGIPQYSINGSSNPDRFSAQSFTCFPAAYQDCWWYVSNGTVTAYYDDLLIDSLNTNASNAVIRLYSPEDSLLAEFNFEIQGDPNPLTPGAIYSGNQSLGNDDIPSPIIAKGAKGGICETYQYEWQYTTSINTPDDQGTVYYDIEGADEELPLIFDAPQEVAIAIRRRTICGEDTAYTAAIIISLKYPVIESKPGAIISGNQYISKSSVPAIISTTPGQSKCSPIKYEWQTSVDGNVFTDIGQISQDLSLTTTLSQPTFYRRKAILCDTINAYTNAIYITFTDDILTDSLPYTPPVYTELDSILMESHGFADSIFHLKNDSAVNIRPDETWYSDSLNKIYRLNKKLIEINKYPYDNLTPQQIDLFENAPLIDDIDLRLQQSMDGKYEGDSIPIFVPQITDSMLHLYKDSAQYDVLDSIINSAPQITFEGSFFQVEQQLQDSFNRYDTVFLNPVLMRQSAEINGEVIVKRDSIERYTATFHYSLEPQKDIRWVVQGGTIISSNTDVNNGEIYAKIKWLTNKGLPFVGIIEVNSKQYNARPVVARPQPSTAYPSMQYAVYGQQLTDITASSCLASIPSGYEPEYQWQKLDFYGDNIWNNLSGENNASLQNLTAQLPLTGYRRITTVKNTSNTTVCQSTSTIAWVSLQPVFAYNYAYPTNVEYNTVPQFVYSYNPYGGMLVSGSQYSYTWEASENGGPWTQIGTGFDFPNTYTIRYKSVDVRRITTITGAPQGVYSYPEKYWKYTAPVMHFTYYYKTVDYENRNYIRENVVLTRGIENWEDADLLSNEKKVQTTTYLDGLSRPIQVVGKGANYDETNNQWYDMVKSITYEAGGRIDKSFLPYPTTDNPGKFKTNTTLAQPQYYSTEFNDNTAFAKVDYDNSPLNRVKKAYAPGNSWAGTNTGVSGDIEPYSASEGVRRFEMGYDAWYDSYVLLPVSVGTYGSLELIKTVATDEKGKKVITYTDYRGNTVLKKVQLAEGEALTTSHNGWLCTYYVYNDFDQLRFTITPKAVKELVGHNWTVTNEQMKTLSDNLCFWYGYDDLGRMVAKKSPGKAPEYTVYDNRNRIIFTQDFATQKYRSAQPPEYASLQGNGIFTTLYDELNRPVMTGILYSHKITDWEDFSANTPNSTVAIHTTYGGDITVWGSPLTETQINDPLEFTQLSFTYYDDYSYTGAKTYSAAAAANLSYRNASAGGNVDDNTVTNRIAGMATGGKTRILDKSSTPKFLTSTLFYDEEGRGIQSHEDNIGNGVDILSTQYHFDGRVLSTKETHNMPGTKYINFAILTKYKFDKAGKIIGIGKKINDAVRSYAAAANLAGLEEDIDGGYKLTASYTYNKLGRRIKKILSPTYNSGAGLETLDYSYNVRGWLTGINKNYALSEYNGSQWDHYFGMYLGYANADGKFASAQFNGSITGVIWKSQGDNTPRKYDYEYDNANRLTKAIFSQKGSSSENWNRLKVDFSTKDISYDENGNLLSMTNMGILPGAAAPVSVDNLSYTYASKSNRLMRVDDGAGTASGKLGDFKDGGNVSGTDDYAYDGQGRLVLDNNKHIDEIVYNYLDKPESIKIGPPDGSSVGRGNIQYIYDAGGNKQQKIVTESPTPTNGNHLIVTTTTYINSYIYTQVTSTPGGGTASVGNVELQMILHEEGRIRLITPYHNINDPANVIGGGIPMLDGKQGVFDYFIKDNLGNVRATITEEINKASSVCTMENANAAVGTYEESIFGNPGSSNELKVTRIDRPVEWKNCDDPEQEGNDKVSVLKAVSGIPQIGPNVLLRVMAGDVVSGKADYFYREDLEASNSNAVGMLANGFVTALLGGRTDVITHGQEIPIKENLYNSTAIANFFENPPAGSEPDNTVPRAYLNYIFFDEQFNFVGQTSGFKRVATAGCGADPLYFTNVKAVKNGYVYVYLSNESSEKVYFDNFQVTHNRGQLIAEDHYYAYGLRIAGISSKALSSSLNKDLVNYGFAGSYAEELNDFDLNYNEFDLRTYDPQIGRWTTQDPYDEFASPYLALGNDPVNNTDPTGGFLGLSPIASAFVSTLGGAIVGTAVDILSGGDGGTGMAIGAGVGLLSGVSLSCISATGSTVASVAQVGASSLAIMGALNPITSPTIANYTPPIENNYFMYASYSDDGLPWQDVLAGTYFGIIDNIFGSSFREAYHPLNADAYNNSLRSADAAMLGISFALQAHGTTTMENGCMALVAGPEVGGPIIAAGALEVGAGMMIASNVATNMGKGYNYGRSKNQVSPPAPPKEVPKEIPKQLRQTPPNNGKAKPHGGPKHDKAIDRAVNSLRRELRMNKNIRNIRKNQRQVDVKGKRVGKNRPDLQYDLYDERTGKWEHYNVEYDNVPENSVEHGKTIQGNDPNSQMRLIIL